MNEQYYYITINYHRGKGFFPTLIKWFTNSNIAHVSVSLVGTNSPLEDEYESGKHVDSDVNILTHLNNISGRNLVMTYDADLGREMIGYRGMPNDKRLVARDIFRVNHPVFMTAHEHLVSCLGTGYDYSGVLGFVFRGIKQDEKRLFCSESVGYILNILSGGSLGTLMVDRGNLSPRDINLMATAILAKRKEYGIRVEHPVDLEEKSK